MMGSNQGYLLKSFLLYQGPGLAPADATTHIYLEQIFKQDYVHIICLSVSESQLLKEL